MVEGELVAEELVEGEIALEEIVEEEIAVEGDHIWKNIRND